MALKFTPGQFFNKLLNTSLLIPDFPTFKAAVIAKIRSMLISRNGTSERLSNTVLPTTAFCDSLNPVGMHRFVATCNMQS